MDDERIQLNVAKNITAYRKICNLTQSQVANKIAYSDKTISKWERGEGMPDIFALYKLSELFEVSLNDMISDKVKKQQPIFLRNRFLITMLSCLLVWLIAVIIYVVLYLLPNTSPYIWMTYIYALMVTCIVLVVFTCMWSTQIIKLAAISGLIWTTCLSIYLTLAVFFGISQSWLVFLIGIPVEALFMNFFLLKKNTKY